MTNDEAFLRMKTREWERRFVDGHSSSIQVMIVIVNEFIRLHGFNEYERIHKEVVGQTAREMMAEHISKRFNEIS